MSQEYKRDLHPALKEALQLIERARADKEIAVKTLKQQTDHFWVVCRDLIHEAQMSNPTDHGLLHHVQDAIDNYLNYRSKD